MNVVSFTGSRHGLTWQQSEALGRLMRVLFGRGWRESHHGCAKGADAAFALLSREFLARVVAHPGDLPGWTSEEALAASDLVLPARRNRARNLDLVRAGSALVACPAGAEADPTQRRSGTFQTIRQARDRALPVALITPEGEVTLERWPG